ncbi:MAG: DUF115 domain-containing protein [Acidobacteria bacterium]|nr:DUF115 domain-containing protein [Acidobacteriota bacterium]
MVPEIFRVIGSDRCLTAAEAASAAEAHPLTATAWDVYAQLFRCFTGSTLDPQFHYLSHPATRTGAVRLNADEAVVIVGTGPSLPSQIDALVRARDHLRLFTSLRGAEALLGHGIVPDLVLIEHRTALDAHDSARQLADCSEPVLARCPLVAADWRTPPALLASVAPAALFVPSRLPTWGLWPATAAALAVDAGASAVALLGIDLGTPTAPDPAHAPLKAVLELLAQLVPAATYDCGAGGVPKRGWAQMQLEEIAGARVWARLETEMYLAPHRAQRLRNARAARAELVPILERAASLETLALKARALRGRWAPALEAGIDEIMSWRDDARVRILLQESLGVSFLPRFWRIGIAPSVGAALWRPLLLATHEMMAQAGALSSELAAEQAA